METTEQRVTRIAVMGQHVQWLINALGPVNAAEIARQTLEMLAGMATQNGEPLHPDLERLRDAARTAAQAFREALESRVVVAPASVLPNGKKLRSV